MTSTTATTAIPTLSEERTQELEALMAKEFQSDGSDLSKWGTDAAWLRRLALCNAFAVLQLHGRKLDYSGRPEEDHGTRRGTATADCPLAPSEWLDGSDRKRLRGQTADDLQLVADCAVYYGLRAKTRALTYASVTAAIKLAAQRDKRAAKAAAKAAAQEADAPAPQPES